MRVRAANGLFQTNARIRRGRVDGRREGDDHRTERPRERESVPRPLRNPPPSHAAPHRHEERSRRACSRDRPFFHDSVGTARTIHGECGIGPVTAHLTNDCSESSRSATRARAAHNVDPLAAERRSLHGSVRRMTYESDGATTTTPREQRKLCAVKEAQHPGPVAWLAELVHSAKFDLERREPETRDEPQENPHERPHRPS